VGSGLSSDATSHFRTTPYESPNYNVEETLKLKTLSCFKISQGSCKVIEIHGDRFEVFILYVYLLIVTRTYSKHTLNYFLSLSVIRGNDASEIFLRKIFLIEVKYGSIHCSVNFHSSVGSVVVFSSKTSGK
jgi:hypothetical protein